MVTVNTDCPISINLRRILAINDIEQIGQEKPNKITPLLSVCFNNQSWFVILLWPEYRV